MRHIHEDVPVDWLLDKQSIWAFEFLENFWKSIFAVNHIKPSLIDRSLNVPVCVASYKDRIVTVTQLNFISFNSDPLLFTILLLARESRRSVKCLTFVTW